MDEIGVDIQVLHNSMFIEPVTSRAEVEIALYGAYNRWLADIWNRGKGRLRWSCMAPTLSMADAIDQIRFAKQHGACAVVMRPLEGGRVLADTYFFPLYEEASKLDMPIAVHIANGCVMLNELYLQHPQIAAYNFARFRVPTITTFTDVLFSEIPRVFPKLRWGFIEAGAQWLPWILREARSRFALIGLEWGEDALRRMYVTCENGDDLPYIVQSGAEETLVIGTDYGHFDPSSDADAIKVFKGRTDVPPEARQKILSDNPRALYAL
jgi:predicted TIM-barrel fold metal-dependent hydrolase